MKIKVQNRTYSLTFCLHLFWTWITRLIVYKDKSSVLILAMVMEGTVSQIFNLGPSSRFFFNVTDFWHKIKTKT